MRVHDEPHRTIWPAPALDAVYVIDQRLLPHRFAVARLGTVDAVLTAIRDMWVRGAPLIGAAAAYGLALQARADARDAALQAAAERLGGARPTAVNLAWALRRMLARLLPAPVAQRETLAWREAARIADDDVACNEALGTHGAALLAGVARRGGRRVNVLTHCNAGWLATVDWGTALAPVYKARDAGVDVHVWVDETRPRNQGASLTAWELAQEGIAHTVIADNTGGHLMQRGEVDLVIVGCDRVTRRGDVCNKIGTYLKALAARDNGVPLYVAMPLSTLDRALLDGQREIPIEERSPREITHIAGLGPEGEIIEVQLTPAGTPALNVGFDVTPARLVSGLITERGIVAADEAAIAALEALS
jgi:methylthioribose-1-phosphate isomerase